MKKAIFAAGCFWGVQYYFDQVPGIVSTRVGYIGGRTADPTYEDVCSHTTGHAEAVEIIFDPTVVSYEALVRHFFRLHDPTQLNRQGPDVGDNYRSAIFYITADQKSIAENVIQDLQRNMPDKIMTEVNPESPFYEAEAYHQKFAARTGRGTCHVPYRPLESNFEGAK